MGETRTQTHKKSKGTKLGHQGGTDLLAFNTLVQHHSKNLGNNARTLVAPYWINQITKPQLKTSN